MSAMRPSTIILSHNSLSCPPRRQGVRRPRHACALPLSGDERTDRRTGFLKLFFNLLLQLFAAVGRTSGCTASSTGSMRSTPIGVQKHIACSVCRVGTCVDLAGDRRGEGGGEPCDATRGGACPSETRNPRLFRLLHRFQNPSSASASEWRRSSRFGY